MKQLFLILSIILSVLYVIFIKYYIKTSNYIYLISILILDIVAIYISVILLSNNNSSTLYCISKISTIIIVLLISIALFGDTLTIKNWIGFALAVVSLLLLY